MPTHSPQVSVDDFLLEVDHIFVHTIKGAARVSVLQELGLHCSDHLVRRVEQGTASKIIFFENAYLELIWIEDEHAVEQQAVRTGIDILGRFHWQHTGASPFGIGLRGKSGTAELMPHSNPHWAEWMRPEMSIRFAAENLASVEEPIYFVIPDSIALTTWLDRSCEAHRQLISHPLGVRKLTGVKITVNSDKELTDAVSLLCLHGVVAIERGMSPLLEITFDSASRGKIIDARPVLPIVLKY
jgi:hypothetical protein